MVTPDFQFKKRVNFIFIYNFDKKIFIQLANGLRAFYKFWEIVSIQ